MGPLFKLLLMSSHPTNAQDQLPDQVQQTKTIIWRRPLILWETEEESAELIQIHVSGSVWAKEKQDLMGEDEGEEINAKVGKDVAHPSVGVHGAADYLSWNARQH